MMSLDRTQAPEFKLPDRLTVPQIQVHKLDNGCDLYLYQRQTESLIKLEIYFDFQVEAIGNPAARKLMSKLIREGTIRHNSSYINEKLERLGAFLDFSMKPDGFSTTVYMMQEKADEVMDILLEILLTPDFPEKEWEKLKMQEISSLRINKKKTSFHADRQLKRAVFGNDHSYYFPVEEEHLNSLSANEIKDFYSKYIVSHPFRVFMTGEADPRTFDKIVKRLGRIPVNANYKSEYKDGFFTSGRVDDTWDDAVQSSLRMARPMPNRFHADTHEIMLANQVLGGYFGSRLMKQIREEKGYTYGIFSSLKHFSKASYLLISTEVVKENREDALTDIYKEIEILAQEPVSQEELETVRNYYIGSLQSSLTSPFAIMELHKIIIRHNLPVDYFQKRIESIQLVTPQKIQEHINNFFYKDDFAVISIG